MSAETPDSLLKSALEKIVYFEARSTQLTNDLTQARGDVERLKAELAQASQREVELRKVVAELEVRATRAHSEREELAGLADALRRERADLIAKMLDASRLQGGEATFDGLDLAQFIAELRREVLRHDGAPVAPSAPAIAVAPLAPASSSSTSASASAAERFATELKREGRLSVSEAEASALSGGHAFPGRSEETLFGFSVRELAAPDLASRVRAAERLTALAHPAAAPAIATALHAEVEPAAQVALLGALSALAKAEAVPVVTPLLDSKAPDVRIAALKALLALDPKVAGPYLASATKDPDRSVRRRASLLALGLPAAKALELGSVAIRDADADVRSLAALVLGASAGTDEHARALLLEAIRDPELRVRRSASQALSAALGRDVTPLVSLDDAQRRREVRRLANPTALEQLPKLASRLEARPAPAPVAASPRVSPTTAAPVVATSPRVLPTPATAAVAPSFGASPVVAQSSAARLASPGRTVVLEEAPAPVDPAVRAGVLGELRASIRGRALPDLASALGAEADAVLRACGALLSEGAVLRRGHKYFIA